MDSVQYLTRGSPVSLYALLSNLDPSRGSFTGVLSAEGIPELIGQMGYTLGARSAHMTFIAPSKASSSPGLPELFDGLVCQAGEWGALNLLAEVDEHDPIFENLRHSGFTVYGWQRIWRFAVEMQPAIVGSSEWKPVTPMDEIPIRSLYQQLVPPLVQQAEPQVGRIPQGMLYRIAGDIVAFVESVKGPQGIYLQPVIHPSVVDVPGLLRSLIASFVNPSAPRPIFLAVRHYQAWLENALDYMQAHASPRQALFVRHLANVQRVPAFNKAVNVIDAHQAEPTSPIVTHLVGYDN
jgi:hypothetical protein